MVTRAGLSVIVPVHNEERYIGPCLDALIEQQHDLVDIVVVDNNCTDSTVDVVRRAQERCPKIKLVQESKPGVAHARNAGFEAADGDILGRVDADTRVRPHWARAVCDFFGRGDTEEVGAISGLNNSYDSPYRRIKGGMSKSRFSVAFSVESDRIAICTEPIWRSAEPRGRRFVTT